MFTLTVSPSPPCSSTSQSFVPSFSLFFPSLGTIADAFSSPSSIVVPSLVLLLPLLPLFLFLFLPLLLLLFCRHFLRFRFPAQTSPHPFPSVSPFLRFHVSTLRRCGPQRATDGAAAFSPALCDSRGTSRARKNTFPAKRHVRCFVFRCFRSNSRDSSVASAGFSLSSAVNASILAPSQLRGESTVGGYFIPAVK